METTDGRLPVLVLTGFLGSGKTTLLNALLGHPELEDTAVVVNELGEIGVDHLLVTGSVDNILLLDGGCLCCSLLGTLRDTLLDLYGRRSVGEVPPFRRVLVETSGLADPAPILQTLLRDSLVGPYYRLDGLVTVVDALFAETELEQYRESVQQVALADRLIVTKTDLTGGHCPPTLEVQLRSLNASAPLHAAQFGVIEPARLLGSGKISLRELALRGDEPGDTDRAGHQSRHSPAVRTDSFVLAEPATWAGLAGWTDLVKEFFGKNMLRCKGILKLAGVDGPVLVQGVQNVFAQPVTLDSWPDNERYSRLVCISRDLDPAALRASLKLLHAEPGTYRPASIQELIDSGVADNHSK